MPTALVTLPRTTERRRLQRPGMLERWHLDCHRRDGADGRWQVRWSQATQIVGS